MKTIEGGRGLIVGFEEWKLQDYPNLEVVGCNATSTEHLDFVREAGIKVIDLKGETEFLKTITSTAEHTIGLMIALARDYKKAFQTEERVIGHRLAGKRFHIIGYGRIGKKLPWILDGGLKMYVTYMDKDSGFSDTTTPIEDADFVSLHIPLEGNEGFFTKEMFKQMKPTAYFINTSRPQIVEKGALRWALDNNEIAGAAVDFIEDDLLDYEGHNLIMTNHLGGATFEDMQKTEDFIVEKVKEYLRT